MMLTVRSLTPRRWESSPFLQVQGRAGGLWGPLTVLLLLLLGGVQGRSCSRWGGPSGRSVSLEGDVVIGGLFSLYYIPSATEKLFTQNPRDRACSGLDLVSLKYMYGMTFAVEEINRNRKLLPGVAVGYRILDSCARSFRALKVGLALVGGDEDRCDSAPFSSNSSSNLPTSPGTEPAPVPLLIGPSSSTTTMSLSRVLEPLSVPLISYLASCPCLSDRLKFPNVFRTIPSDVFQARAMAQLALRFNWTWIGAVVVNNDYGLLAIQAFQEATRDKGVCLAFMETVRKETIGRDAQRVADTIQTSSARVIVVFTWYTDAKEVLLELARRNVTDRQFLASEAWSTSEDLLQDASISSVASGVLGVAIRSAEIPGFEDYIRSLHPADRPDDSFLRELWVKMFGCDGFSVECDGSESLSGVQNHFTDVSELRVTYNVYLAVYAAAHALHLLLDCSSSSCSSTRDIQPRELLQHLKAVNFTTPQGETFYFDGGDTTAKYDLVNWQTTPEGLQVVRIGQVHGFDLQLDQDNIQWSSGTNQVPVSVCSAACPPGSRMAVRKGEPSCCFDCVPCADGEISNHTSSAHCTRCPSDFWSDPERTACVPRQLDFLSFSETLGITLTTAAVSGVAVTTAVLVVFLYYRHTPMVRANNSELSFLLLVSLKLCFLCSLVFIGRPSVWSCRVQQAAFGVSFVLCVSCLLVKTLVVLAVFRSARPGAEALMKWFGPGQQRGSVFLFTSIQVVICATWLTLAPPVPRRDPGLQGSVVTLECFMSSVLGFSLVLGYIGLLALVCLALAFLARKLPDNFNEAKLITFSMLIFCAVWIAFVPAYVSSPGKFVVAVEIFAILASSYGLLLCVFAPKCFIILLRPEKNTKKHLMAR